MLRDWGDFRFSLPNERQGFVRLTAEPQSDLVAMTFLGSDAQTVFSVAPCPPGDPINFILDYGFVFSNSIVFHVDPGPPPYAVYWNYSVTNSTDGLRINGMLGTAQQSCVDVPTQFSHTDLGRFWCKDRSLESRSHRRTARYSSSKAKQAQQM